MSSEIESLSTSYLFGERPYVEELYEAYLDNPGSVPDNWREYFDQLQHAPATDGQESTRDQAHAPIVESFAQRAKANAFVQRAAEPDLSVASKQVSVQSLIAAYRSLGSRWADLDPLAPGTSADPRARSRLLRPDRSRPGPDLLGHQHLLHDRQHHDAARHPEALRDTYCRSIGAEFTHISDPAAKRWIQERLETTLGAPHGRGKRHILQQLTESEGLERFLHTKYVGQKRFAGRRRELHRLDGRSGEPRR